MLGFFRSFLKSRLGVILALVFLALIALAFAGADITGSRFGGVAGGDRAASVGGDRIGIGDLGKTVTRAFESERQQTPTLTMKDFLEQGALDDALSGMVDRTAMLEWGKKYGIVASSRLVDSEIAKISAFQGPDGKFSQTTYKQLIAQRGLTEAGVRNDIGQGLVARQILVPAGFGATMPRDAALRYAAQIKERRDGVIATIPSLAFAPKQPATDQQLDAFYKANLGRYRQPERRTVRYAFLDEAALKSVPAPSDAEVAERYKLNAATYAASETRTVTQVIVPTEAAARALAAEVGGGKAIEAIAKEKGLGATKLPDLTREALSSQASDAVAAAVFATAQGQVAAPARSPIGWHVIRVDAITRKPGKTLDQARAEIVAAMTLEKRRAALTDMSAKIEQQFENGTSLADVAKSMGLTVQTTAPLLATGQVFGKPAEKAPADVAPLLPAAFSMEREGEPQISEVPGSTKFALFDVGEITEAAPAPLAQIKDVVARDYAADQGSAQAKIASDKIMAALAKGTSLAEALKTLGVALPAPQAVNMERQQLAAAGGRVPAPLALMFSMAKKTSKRLEAPGKQGWFIVTLNDIIPGQVAANDPMLPTIQRELGAAAGRELADELRTAIRNEIGVKRNETAIAALRKQLTGGQ